MLGGLRQVLESSAVMSDTAPPPAGHRAPPGGGNGDQAALSAAAAGRAGGWPGTTCAASVPGIPAPTALVTRPTLRLVDRRRDALTEAWHRGGGRSTRRGSRWTMGRRDAPKRWPASTRARRTWSSCAISAADRRGDRRSRRVSETVMRDWKFAKVVAARAVRDDHRPSNAWPRCASNTRAAAWAAPTRAISGAQASSCVSGAR